MIIYIFVVLRYCVVNSILKVYSLHLRLPLTDFIFLVVATVLIAAGGYIINDYFDRETDKLNEKDPVVGYYLSTNLAIILYAILSITGLIAGFYVSLKIGYPRFSLIFFIAATLLWFYSCCFKGSFLLGNLIVSFLAALVPLLIAIYDLLPAMKYYTPEIRVMDIDLKIIAYWLIAYAAFAFIFTLIREIVKDMEDLPGDISQGYSTLPIVFGEKITKIFVIILILAAIAGLILIFIKYLQTVLSLIYLGLFLILPALTVIILIIKAKSPKDYHKISNLLKITMLLGISYAFVACYTFARL